MGPQAVHKQSSHADRYSFINHLGGYVNGQTLSVSDDCGVTRTEFSLLELDGDHGIMIVDGYASGRRHSIPSQLVGFSQHSIKSSSHRRWHNCTYYPCLAGLCSYGYTFRESPNSKCHKACEGNLQEGFERSRQIRPVCPWFKMPSLILLYVFLSITNDSDNRDNQ